MAAANDGLREYVLVLHHSGRKDPRLNSLITVDGSFLTERFWAAAALLKGRGFSVKSVVDSRSICIISFSRIFFNIMHLFQLNFTTVLIIREIHSLF